MSRIHRKIGGERSLTAEMPDLVIHLRGPLRIATGDGRPLAGLTRRGQAMLVCLALQPGMRAERGYLAELLWSDRSEEQSRASLRQELSVLKRAVPEAILAADRQAVWLDAGAVQVDEGGAGDLLEGFDLASEGFEDWLRQARAGRAADAPAETSAAARGERPTLAVLPFEEFGAAARDMFADGVVDEITSALSRCKEFRVIARQSAFALGDPGLSVPEAAARLKADYIVEGSVRRAGERLRISVQLVRGHDGHTLWTARFDDRLDDLFDLLDRIAAQVAGQILPNLRAAEIARAREKQADQWIALQSAANWEIYTDGSAPIKNPGGAIGFSAVFLTGDQDAWEVYGGTPGRTSEPATSNNRAEIAGALTILEVLYTLKSEEAPLPKSIEIVCDSQYVVNCAQGKWKKKKNKDLWNRFDRLLCVARQNKVRLIFRWTRAHVGTKWNERADVLAKDGAFLAIGNSPDSPPLAPPDAEAPSKNERPDCHYLLQLYSEMTSKRGGQKKGKNK